MSKKILITGSTGFLGTEICSQLKKRNIKAICLFRNQKKKYKNQNIKWINSDLKISKINYDKIKSFEPECIFHLAWDKIPIFNKKTCTQNLNQSIRFLEKITKIKSIKKVIISGSCNEYHIKKGIKKENSKLDLKNHFSNSKNSLYFFSKKLCKKRGIKLAWFRIFYLYGINQRKEALIPYIINSVKNKKKININNPDLKLDYINVTDVANFFYKTLEISFSSGAYNLGTSKSISIKSILRKILKVTKNNNQKNILTSSNSKNKIKKIIFTACMKKSEKIFKIKNYKSFKNGISEMVKFYYKLS